MRIVRMIVALARAFEHDSPDFHRLWVSRTAHVSLPRKFPTAMGFAGALGSPSASSALLSFGFPGCRAGARRSQEDAPRHGWRSEHVPVHPLLWDRRIPVRVGPCLSVWVHVRGFCLSRPPFSTSTGELVCSWFAASPQDGCYGRNGRSGPGAAHRASAVGRTSKQPREGYWQLAAI